MKKTCPQCATALDVPRLKDYDEHFICPHCQSTLAHSEADIILYALGFIVLLSLPLTFLLGVNAIVALLVTMMGYHFLRPRFFEPHFRIKATKPTK